jgi:hypothetical protein
MIFIYAPAHPNISKIFYIGKERESRVYETLN